LKDVKKKQAAAKNQMIFLKRCIHHNIVPKFLNVRSPIKSKNGINITKDYQRKLLIAAKNEARYRFHFSIKKCNELIETLTETLNGNDLEFVTSFTDKAKERTFKKTKDKLVNKFHLLLQNNSKKHTLVKDAILNLAGNDIPNHHKNILNLGPKFVPTIRNIPYMEIITTTEQKALELERNEKQYEAERLRQTVQNILKKSTKKPKSNLTKEQSQALKELKSSNQIDIYPFDKGSGFVIIKHEDALNKIEEQIGHTKIVNKDPTKSLINQFQITLRKLKKENKFNDREYQKLYPTDGIPPRMYGMIKAHKPQKNYPMRIVVSTIGSPPYETSKYLVDLIQPTLNKNQIRVINSKTFVQQAKEWIPDPNEIQVSFDAVNLYPSVPIKKATNVIVDILQNDFDNIQTRTKLTLIDIRSLIELCLKKCYFSWNNKIRMLDDAGPIGLSLMVVIAEAFLQFIEKNAIEISLRSIPPASPITYRRYVDDTHSRFIDIEISKQFLNILNQQEPKIQFTAEYENDNKELNFLDVTIKNNNNGKYEFKIHRKNAITNVQIKPHSSISPNIKDGVFKGFLARAYTICSPQYLENEIKFLRSVFIENGYKDNQLDKIIKEYKPKDQRPNIQEPEPDNKITTSLPWIPGVSTKLKRAFKKENINVAFKSGKNLQDILCKKNKSTLPPLSSPGVYKVSCSCGKAYVGETGACIKTRIKQHQKATFEDKVNDSAIAEHHHDCRKEILWEETKQLSSESNYFKRKIREALEIQKRQTHTHGINKDNGTYVTTQSWIPLLRTI